ncbi:MAG: 2-succinyl-5-enolpyruvyl-6-hydroxy-3-cyclohexene-carboxylate synthase [Actinomycetota bacterium]
MTGIVSDIGTANATFSATLVDEWIRCGVRHAVISPGSRSTPLAVALAERPELAIEVVVDERVAAFAALGLGLDGVPAVLLCTSGTAAVNFHPAIVEASTSEVPMLVCTADRPPELRGVGAPQTIDQLRLYGRSVRWFHDAPPPDSGDPTDWRRLAQTAFGHAAHGPAHLNLPFREPLLGEAGELPEPIGPPEPLPKGIATTGPLSADFDVQRGVIVVGGRSGQDPSRVVELAQRLAWPILACPMSGVRGAPNAITTFDSLLRHDRFADDHAPELVVRFGRPPASKVLSQWILRTGAPVVQVGGPGLIDPDRNVVAHCSIDDLAVLSGAPGTPWMARWRHADDRAEQVLAEELGVDGPLTEPAVARTVADRLPEGVDLVVSSSMPVRDLEWFGGRRAAAHGNRGANGIDGVVSTALGRASAGRPVAVLIGDLAFVHDSNALVGLAARSADLRVVVVDNGGGGIFGFLPQAGRLAKERFEQLFGTPHGTDVVGLAASHGVRSTVVTTIAGLAEAIARPGPSVTVVRTDRAANVEEHRRLHAAVAAALG